jgi:hypothetical protein
MMTEETEYSISVERVARIIREMSAEEKGYLVCLVPELRKVEPLKPPEPTLRPSEEFLVQLRREILEARGGVPPSDEDPFIGQLTVGEYLALSDEEQEELWDELYAQASAELDKEDYEHPVKPDALIAGQEHCPQVTAQPLPPDRQIQRLWKRNQRQSSHLGPGFGNPGRAAE